ncbi:hypothetical protein A2U01_0067506, partial [Trifolium medium]|nr:hypothetical protein [Trifolium medium]
PDKAEPSTKPEKKKKSHRKKKLEEDKAPVDNSMPKLNGEPEQKLTEDAQPKPSIEEQVVSTATNKVSHVEEPEVTSLLDEGKKDDE